MAMKDPNLVNPPHRPHLPDWSLQIYICLTTLFILVLLPLWT